MKSSEHSIIDYIPQRPPFVMIHSIEEVDEISVKSSFTILEDNILVEDGIFSEVGMIENMAQTGATHIGYYSRLNQNSVPIGFIAMIKNIEILEVLPVNTKIETYIIRKYEVMDFFIIEGMIKHKGNVIAKCEMRVYLSPN